MKHDFQPESNAFMAALVCIRCGKKIAGAAMWMVSGPFEEECPGAQKSLTFTFKREDLAFDELDWRSVNPADPAPDACECGAHKALNIGKHQIGHASYCPWRAP